MTTYPTDAQRYASWHFPEPAAGRWHVKITRTRPDWFWTGRPVDLDRAIAPVRNVMQALRQLRAIAAGRVTQTDYQPIPQRVLEDGEVEYFLATLASSGGYSTGNDLVWHDRVIEPSLEYEVQRDLLQRRSAGFMPQEAKASRRRRRSTRL